jgi:subfamily B ATP-binding cassette protein MsbA
MRSYRRLLEFSQKYWGLFALGILGTIALSLVDAAFSWMVKPLINEGLINRNLLFIKWLPVFITLAFVMRGVSGFTSNYFISRVARNVVMDFRNKIFAKFLEMPAAFFDQNSSGHLLSTIIYNVEQVAEASSDALITCLQESTLAAGLIIVMLVVSWQLSLIFLIISPIVGFVMKWSSSRLRRLSLNVQQSVGEVTHVANESIKGYQIIRLYGGQDYEYDKFREVNRRNRHRELKIVITNSIGTAWVQFLISIPIAMALVVAMLPSLHVSAGSFGSAITAMVMILRPVRRLTSVNNAIQKGVAGADSIFSILDLATEMDTGTKTIAHASGKIEFKDVQFSYNSSKNQVLDQVNLLVQPGQTIAIVGRSGSGKTTLVNLLPRFYEPQSGIIKIDDIDIREYRLSDLRSQFALVSQNPILFNDTIANNIAYGLQGEVGEQQIIEAAEAAHALEFIQNLSDGFNTQVGEEGVLLSGGQRQRIAIARAILKNAPILILDEATSALDSHSERHIQQGLERLMAGRTTFVIAHRLSTIENADRVVVMDKGKIVEQGTHQELIKKEGAYAALHRLQFRDFLSNHAQPQAETSVL